MKSFQELRTAVENAQSPQACAGTFIDGYNSLIENNVNDPAKLKSIISDVRSNRSSLVHSLSGSGHTSTT